MATNAEHQVERMLEQLALHASSVADLEARLNAARTMQKEISVRLVNSEHLTQSEVARVAGINRQTLIRWCKEWKPGNRNGNL